jgi:membrane protease YdiL (CAAX protease family)
VALFVSLVFATAVPFYVVGALFGDLRSVGLPLPVSALMVVCPTAAAALLLSRRPGGIRCWLRAGLRRPTGRKAWWLLPGVALMPLVLVSACLVAGLAVPVVDWSALPQLAVVFVLGAVAEELGWTGYATEAMAGRYSALATGLVLGAVGAAWHVVPFAQGGNPAAWIVGQCLFTVAFRVVLVRMYLSGGRSLIIPVLGHAGYNLTWVLLTAAGPDYYDPATVASITAAVAAILAAAHRASTARS